MVTRSPRDVWRGNPISAEHQPDPSEIVTLVDEIIASVAQTTTDAAATAADRVQTGADVVASLAAADRAEDAAAAAEDAVQYDYLFDDDADRIAQTGMTTGQRGYVRDTEHVWEYDGAAWDDLGLAPSAGKTPLSMGNALSETNGAPLVGRRPIITDKSNVLGGGAAVYVPRELSLRNAAGVIFTTSLTPDAKFPDHHKVALTASAASTTVYFDRSLGTVIAAATSAVPVDATRYYHIVTLYGATSGRGEGATSALRVQDVQDEGVSIYSPTSGYLGFDRVAGKLYVPEVGVVAYGGAGYTIQALASGDSFREVNIPTSGYWSVWYDVFARVQFGSRAAEALVLRTDASAGGSVIPSRDGSAGLVLVATGNGYQVAPAAGFGLAEIVANEFQFGREDADGQTLWSSTQEMITISDTDLVALDLTRGVHSTDAGARSPASGGRFARPVRGGYAAYRFYLLAPSAGAFGTPRVSLQYQNDARQNLTVNIAVSAYREISTTVREYRGVVAIPDDRPYLGLTCGTVGVSNDIVVAGVQFAASGNPAMWIRQADYPRAGAAIGDRLATVERIIGVPSEPADYIIPPALYLVEDQDYTLFPDQMARNIVHGRLRATLTTAGAAIGDRAWSAQSTGGSLEINEAKLSTDEAALWLKDLGQAEERIFRRDVAIKRASAAEIAALPAVKMTWIGDSYGMSWVYATAAQYMRALGMTVTGVGTLTQTASGPAAPITGVPDILGESRGGKGLVDFINQRTSLMTPAASPATYLALSDTARRDVNPLIRPSTGGDDPDYVHNGHIFDFGQYLTDYSIDTPDVVGFAHGYNDVTEFFNDDAGIRLLYSTGLRGVLTSIRAAAPDALIVMAYYSVGRWSGAGNENVRWNGRMWSALEEINKLLIDLADPGIILAPVYCTLSRDAGFVWADDDVSDGGTILCSRDDFTHPSNWGARDAARIIAHTAAVGLVNA